MTMDAATAEFAETFGNNLRVNHCQGHNTPSRPAEADIRVRYPPPRKIDPLSGLLPGWCLFP